MGLSEMALGLTISLAAWTDWRERRIYNKLLGPAFLAALAIHFYNSGWPGLKESLLGALIGFSLLLLPYFLGGMGAGDVKLMAVIGAYGGMSLAIKSFLFGATVGGAISALLLLRRKAFLITLKHLFLFFPLLLRPKGATEFMTETGQEKFPYGIALSIGALLAFILPLKGVGR